MSIPDLIKNKMFCPHIQPLNYLCYVYLWQKEKLVNCCYRGSSNSSYEYHGLVIALLVCEDLFERQNPIMQCSYSSLNAGNNS